MAHIASDSVEVSQNLEELINLCEKSGARFHPDLTIQYQNSDFSIICTKPIKGRLANLTQAGLIPVDSKHFTLEDERLALKENADTGWSSLQEDIAHTMLSIFNHGQKIKQFRKRSFWLTVPEDSELRSHISVAKRFQPSDNRFLDRNKSQYEQDQAVINGFFNSRVLGLSKEGRQAQRVIMPVIDYMNHHWRGASYNYQTTASPGLLSVDCAQPNPDSNECFAFYNTMDALDSYIKYGFADLSAPLVRSVSLDINIENLGTIHILGSIAKTARRKSLKSFNNIPRQVPLLGEVIKGSHLNVSHIFIPGPNTPFAMKRILAALIQNLSVEKQSMSDLRKIIRNCEEQIVEANIVYYKKLEAMTNLEHLSELANSQLNKINRYVQQCI